MQGTMSLKNIAKSLTTFERNILRRIFWGELIKLKLENAT